MKRLTLALFGAGALFALGLDLVTRTSLRVSLLAALLMALGVSAYAWSARRARRRGVGDATLRRAILVAGVLVLAPFAARAAANLLSQHRHLEIQDPELGWAPAPTSPPTAGRHFQRIDPAREHVVALGDSVFHGTGVEPHETVAHALEGLLPGYQVLNHSVPGYSIDQYYLYLARLLPHVRPRLVVVGVFVGNDFQVTGMEVGWESPKPLFRVEGGALVRANPGSLEGGCVRHLAESFLFRFVWPVRPIARALVRVLCAPRRLGVEETEEVVGELFAAIEALARRHGAKVLFVLLPLRDELWRLRDAEARYTSRYEHLRRVLERGRHLFYEFFPDARRAGGAGEVFLDPGHYTPYGHRVLAEALARVIRERGLLP